MLARQKLLTTGLTILLGFCLAFAVAQANVTINSDVDGTLTLNDVEYIVAGSSVEVGGGLFGPSSLEATLSLNGQSVDPLLWVPIELLCHLTGYVADPIILADAGATLTATITISGTGFSGTMTDVCSGSIALSKAELESGNFDALYNHSVSGNLTIDDETQVGLPYEKKEMRFHFEDDGTGSGSATFTATYNEATVEVSITYSFTYSGSVDWNLPADFGGYAKIVSINDNGTSSAITGYVNRSKRSPGQVPSLTTYGLIVLTLLLLAASVWIMFRKTSEA